MKVEDMITMREDRNRRAFLGGVVAFAALVTLLLASTPADSANPKGAGSVGKSNAVRLEDIPGSTVKRVILSPKAAERLGIETGKIGEERIVRKQMVGGRVILPLTKPSQHLTGGGFAGFRRVAAAKRPQPDAGSAKSSPPKETWLLVTLSPGEWDRLQKDKPARVLPLDTRAKLKNEVIAVPTGISPRRDMKRSMLTLYYKVPGKDHGLKLYHRVRVELQLSGSDKVHKVVPYGAVYYDSGGTAWVYTNPKRLVFERRRIGVERVVGNLAVLSDGPPVGTPVVTVGAALLFGAEVVFGR